MKLEAILDLWKEDAKIDKTEITDESINISKLHHKYYGIFVSERIGLRSLEADFKKLKLEKYEFFSQGPNEETQAKGWKMPAVGRILKDTIPMYLDADQDMIDLSLKIGIQKEKVEALSAIIQVINNRGYQLKTAVDFLRFTHGG